jgi:lipopolysaccharide/colanic/teichoic acid biosynthesis glycosyltransferase
MALILLAVPFVLIAAAVKLSSPGPVFYRQRRVGRGGRPFWLYKFRTMRCGAGGPSVTADGDPRVTPAGRFLRALKLDELPQLLNILRGEMSVIGPRPEVERFVALYTLEQRRVLEQTPGLASMAQLVYAHEARLLRGHPDPEEAYVQHLLPRKLAVDLEYERTRTFRSDMRLIGAIVLLLLGKNPRLDRGLRIPAPDESAGPPPPGPGTPAALRS